MERIRYLIIVLLAIYTIASEAKDLIVPVESNVFNVQYGRNVNFDLFGATQVTINLQDVNVSQGISDVIRVALNPKQLGINYWQYDTKAKIKVYPTIKTNFDVTAMVNIPYGLRKLYIKLPEPIKVSNVFKISFNLKQLDPLDSYSLSPDSNKELALTNRSPSKQGDIKRDPVLSTNICDERQKVHFRVHNNGYTIENERSFLEVKDTSRKIGSPLNAIENNSSNRDTWYLVPTDGGLFKIRSFFTDTCMSAVNGFGGKIVMDDCENGNALSWKITFCDD